MNILSAHLLKLLKCSTGVILILQSMCEIEIITYIIQKKTESKKKKSHTQEMLSQALPNSVNLDKDYLTSVYSGLRFCRIPAK